MLKFTIGKATRKKRDRRDAYDRAEIKLQKRRERRNKRRAAHKRNCGNQWNGTRR